RPVHEPGRPARVLRQRRAGLGGRLALRAARRRRPGDRLRPVAGRAVPAPARVRGDRAAPPPAAGHDRDRLDGSRLAFSTEFTFAPQDGATLMTMIQWGFPPDELRDEHGRGLAHAFDRLARAL